MTTIATTEQSHSHVTGDDNWMLLLPKKNYLVDLRDKINNNNNNNNINCCINIIIFITIQNINIKNIIFVV
jgi:hypothetical protein